MSALTRMAFNTHRQVDIQPGDRVIISASAIPGNEDSVGNVIMSCTAGRPRWSTSGSCPSTCPATPARTS